MADKTTSLILDALSRAVADPAGVPLHGKTARGLFTTTAAAKQAAQRCKDEGFLRIVRTETKGKTLHEICAITEKGLAYVLNQVSPKKVLEDLVHALEARQSETGQLLMAARQMQAGLDALKATAEKVLQQVQKPATFPASPGSSNGNENWTGAILSYLTQWQASNVSEDCSLPELFCQAKQSYPALTIGRFHDGLRKLYDQELIYLHPWTGPLYEIPDPPCALLVGHEIAYYASIRQ